MPKRIVVVSLMALSIVSVHHKPAEAAPLSPLGAVAGTKSMAEPVSGCGAWYGPRVAGYSRWDGGYWYRPRVRVVLGWSRWDANYWYRPRAAGWARRGPDYRYGRVSWGDQRAWRYYGRW